MTGVQVAVLIVALCWLLWWATRGRDVEPRPKVKIQWFPWEYKQVPIKLPKLPDTKERRWIAIREERSR